ncbi:MAG TPA: hypothetical protein PKM27_03370 [Saprospiraceae bacterium]|nr:hypothetical protein [Saprospiraceae bacterium]HNT20553.1 hypothetical protein [Saprospiraceae bacterium]
MNQKNVFTALAILLMVQALAFYFMGGKIAMDAFGDLGEPGNMAAKHLMEIMAAFAFNFGLLAYATRSNSQVLWVFTLGFAIVVVVTLKHILADGIHVPIWAIAFQILSLLAVGYLWMRHNKVKPA